MVGNSFQRRYFERPQAQEYKQAGSEMLFRGMSVGDMDRDQLLVVIGVLEEMHDNQERREERRLRDAFVFGGLARVG